MSDIRDKFEKGVRYYVIKRKNLDETTDTELRYWLETWQVPTAESVVVEHDWPIYGDVWEMIEAIATGQPTKLEKKRAEIDALKAENERLKAMIENLRGK